MSKAFKAFGKKKDSSKSLVAAPAAAPAVSLPAVSASDSGALLASGGSNDAQQARADAAAAQSEADKLRAQLAAMGEENTALKGQVHLLKFKVDLLVDMVTLANLDCDKLEDEVCARRACTLADAARRRHSPSHATHPS